MIASPTNLAAFRIAHAEKAPTLRGEQQHIDTRPAKLRDALKTLGNKWVCAPCNRVVKLKEPLPENFTWQPARAKGRKA